MFRACRVCRAMAIGVACKTMNFKVPPTDKKELKKRFITLAKERHPDLNTERSEKATAEMVKLTEAYATLKKLIEAGVTVSATAPMAAGGPQADMASVAASFVTPGSSLSLRGFTLPWQRSVTTTAATKAAAQLDAEEVGFREYARRMRALRRQETQRDARIRDDAAQSAGSHGFTAEHFAEMEKMRERLRFSDRDAAGEQRVPGGGTARCGSVQLLPLLWRYYSKRAYRHMRQAPRKLWDSLRYILQ
ncbi:chaperone protein DNAJ [Strigomonas culicis]|uniref:Chaperone protein DNAJ n=1 Tax=Strigomonas culicis TaxID=28005 RepID=S9W5Q9_9TRYP|nr:chaperone protein DNAJ [Strigomonas culicis]EPY34701.1 chaperone protein DNAJ [Strigomonas culicis]|eukprot:EPY31200.1 chaperone protein DNAJ [Strigomonas culicis]